MAMELALADIWLLIIGFFLVYYVLTDGFDLGVGVLCLLCPDDRDRGIMMDSLSNIWHTNQTWLIVVGGILFGAFPLFYSVLFSALYVPAVTMLLGFVLRGVAFDFREHSRSKRFWILCFALGSLLAALSQGFIFGGLLSGLEMRDGQFAGSVWDWMNPLSGLVAVGVLFAYVTLGASYLILKTVGNLQRRQYRNAIISSPVMLFLSVGAYVWITLRYPHTAEKWLSTPDVYTMAIFPVLAAFSFVMFFRSLRKGGESAPFVWNAALVVFAFLGLSMSLYPHMVPHVHSPLTVTEAAASRATLGFMLLVIGILIPVIVFYTTYTYRVFQGKVGDEEYGE
jgi:cytochrome d ubiquinol oxidase subunit II